MSGAPETTGLLNGSGSLCVSRTASGRADRLSGRHLSVAESLDALLSRIDQVERDDLHTLRLRTGH